MLDALVHTDNVFWFVPNVIGYVRVILLILSLLVLDYGPWPTVILYGLSELLDALDGQAARYYKQGEWVNIATQFGAVLDMVTDRSATACLMLYIGYRYPLLIFPLQVLIALDFSSHYMQMVATLSSGLASHKTTRKDTHWLLQLYYTNRQVLFWVCCGNEMFFILTYMTWFLGWPWYIVLGYGFATPLFIFKQASNVIQLMDASLVLVQIDTKTRARKR